MGSPKTYPMVVMKDGVKLSSEYLRSKQLLPTPVWFGWEEKRVISL